MRRSLQRPRSLPVRVRVLSLFRLLTLSTYTQPCHLDSPCHPPGTGTSRLAFWPPTGSADADSSGAMVSEGNFHLMHISFPVSANLVLVALNCESRNREPSPLPVRRSLQRPRSLPTRVRLLVVSRLLAVPAYGRRCGLDSPSSPVIRPANGIVFRRIKAARKII
jgi:hypothetical protein